MKEVLKQINAVAGTIGSMAYDDQGQLLAHVFPSIFDENMLRGAIATVSGNLPGLDDMTGGVKMVDFRFQNGRVVVRPVDGGCLVLLCESTINLQTLIISVNIAVKKMEKILKADNYSPQQASAPAPVAAAVSSRDLIEKGPFSPQLQGMQTILAKFLGPMAKIIFLECLDKWLLTNQPVKSALPQLVDIVVTEIGDPAKMTEYRQKVSVLL